MGLFAIAAAALSIGGMITSGISAADKAKERRSQYKAQAAMYRGEAQNFRDQAAIKQMNAANMITTGQEQMESGTFKFNQMRQEFNKMQGANKMMVGRSSVEMGGSAEGLIEDNARQMGDDLSQLQQNMGNIWEQSMLARSVTLKESHSFMTQAGVRDDMASKYTGLADKINPTKEGWLTGLASGNPFAFLA